MRWVFVLITPSQTDSKPISELRRLKHLAVVDMVLEDAMDREPDGGLNRETERKRRRGELISILKDSPSTERKFLRWRIAQGYRGEDLGFRRYEVVVDERLEVLPETPL